MARQLRPLRWEGFAFLYVLVLLHCQSSEKNKFTVGWDEAVWNGLFQLPH